MRNLEILANDDRIVRCKDCMHYTPTKYTETGFHCGVLSGAHEYVETEPDYFCCYGQRKEAAAKSGEHVPLVDRETYTNAQEKIREHQEGEPPAPSTATYKRRPMIKDRGASMWPPVPPLGYTWQDGKLVVVDAEAVLVQRVHSELAERGNVSEETYHALIEAKRAKFEAWTKEHQKTK